MIFAIRNSPGNVPRFELFGGGIGIDRPRAIFFLKVSESVHAAHGVSERLRVLLVIVTMFLNLKQMSQSLADLVPS